MIDALRGPNPRVIPLQHSTVEPEPRWLPIPSSARYTGLSVGSIRRLLAAGKLTAFRPVRGRVVLDRYELDSYVLGCNARPRAGRGLR